MNVEELRVLIRTVADTSGAQQANAALRNVAQTGDQVNTSVRRTGQSAREAGLGFGQGTENVLRFVGALTGVQFGLSMFASAGQQVREVLRGSIDAQAENERTVRATAAAYGQAATQYQAFAQSLAQQTGFTSQAILEAALSARTLSQNYGLTIQQTQNLIRVSADLARVRGIGIAESFERIQSAIRGEAEASEFLGLTLNATFLQQNAANGAYRQTFQTLTDTQRAQVVYNEALRQSAQFSGLAAQATRGLDGAMGQVSLATHDLSVELGRLIQPTVITTLQAQTTAALALNRALRETATFSQTTQGNVLSQLAGDATRAVPVLGPMIGILNAIGLGLEALAEPERERIRLFELGQRLKADMLNEERADLLAPAIQRATLVVTGLNEQLRITHTTLQQVAQDISDLGTRGGSLSTVLGALRDGDVGGRAAVLAQQALQQLDARILASRALLAIEQELAREREATKITDPRDAAGARAARDRLAVLAEILPLERQLIQVQDAQRQISDALAQSRADLARVELSMLPARQELARLDREANSAQVELVRLMRERQVLLAQQAAAPGTNALEDTRAQIERDRLVLANRRGTSIEERQAARREIRDLERNVLPGQQLGAFDAQRQLDLARRGAGAADLTEQLRRNAIAQRGAEIRQMIEPVEAQKALVEAQTTQLQLLAQIVQAKEVTIKHQIEVKIDGAVSGTVSGDVAADVAGAVGDRVYRELTEANGQAGLPPTIPVSAVRRG